MFPKKLASPQGFEPRTHGLEGRCSIQLSYEPANLERMMRIELTTTARKAVVLPLNYIRILRRSSERRICKNGAEDEIRTRDPRLGKAMLYP